ncbi:MAG: CBS domain-containing protein [Woeseiaceae bacterium]|nr:CBS domain-containing protein [Woeseiaceae bacterium]
MPRTAREVMVPLDEYPHAFEHQSLRDAVRLLDTAQIRFNNTTSMPRILLVFDDMNRLVGMARRRDILGGLEPAYDPELDSTHPEAHFKTEIDPNLTDLAGDENPERLRRKLDRTLSEVVRELEGQVDVDDSIMKVVRELVGKDTHIAAVLDDGQVIGVVRTLDVLRTLTEDLI